MSVLLASDNPELYRFHTFACEKGGTHRFFQKREKGNSQGKTHEHYAFGLGFISTFPNLFGIKGFVVVVKTNEHIVGYVFFFDIF
jgi:hypothetical protein